jgi:D-alanyl-D-alanine dipeptidase
MQDNLKDRRIFGYQDLITVDVKDNGEALIDVRTYDPSIVAQYAKPDMRPYTGDTILVRDSLARKLAQANKALKDRNLRLKVVYGYRHPQVQEAYFAKRKAGLKKQCPELGDEELNALTHVFVAVPSVGGHPAGGAVDITIVDGKGAEFDMGTAIADFSDPEKIKTFASGLTNEQRRNRRLLHDAMIQEGFAPFYGEWWHFCYGDREWAKMAGEASALYGPLAIQ